MSIPGAPRARGGSVPVLLGFCRVPVPSLLLPSSTLNHHPEVLRVLAALEHCTGSLRLLLVRHVAGTCSNVVVPKTRCAGFQMRATRNCTLCRGLFVLN